MPMIPVHTGGTKPDTRDWRVQLLTRLGAPVDDTNLTALQAWALSESGYNSTYGTNMAGPGYFNPLAISDGYGVPYVRSINSDGVKEFASTQAGVEATVRFLQHGYSPIIDALRSSDPVALFSAVNDSGWCRGCQSGRYPTDLYSWLQGADVQGGTSAFKGSFGSGGPAGHGDGSGQSTGTSDAGSNGDSGGLYGTCKITSSSIPLASFSVPTGGFGCYLEKTILFSGLAFGGGLLMLVGLGLVVAPGLRGSLPLGAGDVAGLGAAIAEKVRQANVAGGKQESVQLRPEPEPQEKPPSLAERREKRQQERHRAALRRERARARVEEARAREAELRAPTTRQRVAAAGRGRTKAAGPVGSGPARLAYEAEGV